MFGVPLVLYPVMMLGVAGVASSQQKQLKEAKNPVVVKNGEDAPKLVELMNRPESVVKVVKDEPDAEKELSTGVVQAIVDVPANAERDAIAGKDVKIDLKVDRSRRATPFVEGKVEDILREYERWIIEQRLVNRGVGANVLKGIKTETIDVATGEQRLGNLMAGILPLFLLITGMLGAFFPALSVTTTEREHGTLETLLVTPAGRGELLIAKGALVLLAALVTAGLNMLSMSLVMWRTFSMLPEKMGVLQISPSGLALAYLAAVPTLIFFSGIVLVVGLMARTYREASSMATPVMLLPVISMVVGLAEPKITAAVLLTPIVNTTVIIREVLTGRATFGVFAAAFAASCVYAGLLVSAAARVFSNEQLVNSNWEPLSIRGLGKLGAARRKRLPGIDEVLALWAVTILLSFYVTPSLASWPLVAVVAVVELGLITLPTYLVALVGKWQWRETFSWRPAKWQAFVGAALAGLGLIPITSTLFVLQNKVWAAPGDYFRMNTEPLARGVEHHAWIVVIAVGVLAGFCEEFLYRGPIQRALLRKMRPRGAVLICAVLFSAAHLDAHGFPIRFLLGVVLGYVVIWTGSIFPAMVLHGVFDATQVAYLAYQVHAEGMDAAINHASTPEAIGGSTMILVAVGAVLLVVGYWLIRKALVQTTV